MLNRYPSVKIIHFQLYSIVFIILYDDVFMYKSTWDEIINSSATMQIIKFC